jgi:transcriptional regulator with XRE-family HTH domain
MSIIRLKDILTEKNFTGKELAAKLGVSQNTISNIVNGHNFPKPSLLLDIATILDIDLRELFVTTKEKDLTDPIEAIKEIKGILEKVKY